MCDSKVVGRIGRELVGRARIELATPGFSVFIPTGDYRAPCDRIGRSPGVSGPGVSIILPDSPYSHSIVLTQN